MLKLDGDKITIGYDFVFPNFVVPNALQTDITIVNYLLVLIVKIWIVHSNVFVFNTKSTT